MPGLKTCRKGNFRVASARQAVVEGRVVLVPAQRVWPVLGKVMVRVLGKLLLLFHQVDLTNPIQMRRFRGSIAALPSPKHTF
jgi:hypothetical protein